MRSVVERVWDVIKKPFYWLNLFAARHALLLVSVVFVSLLIWRVPQVSYAFRRLIAGSGPSPIALWSNFASLCVLLALSAYHVITLCVIAPWDWPPSLGSISVPSNAMMRSMAVAQEPRLWRRLMRVLGAVVDWTLSLPRFLAGIWSRVWRGVLLVVLIAFGGFCLVQYSINEHALRWYPLADLHLVNCGCMSLGLAGWLVYRWAIAKFSPEEHPVVDSFERFAGWLLVTYGVGELIWATANVSVHGIRFAYLAYTQWGFLEIVFLILILARIIDYWDSISLWPIRLFGLVGFGILIWYASLPVALDSETHLVETGLKDQQKQRDTWLQHAKERLAQSPGAPVILVAASGGGSRAAIFTSLVLEGMARDSLVEIERPADHVLLISSVSGGSLAAADVFARHHRVGSDEHQSEVRRDTSLVRYVKKALLECHDQLEMRLGKEQTAMQKAESVQQRRRAKYAMERDSKRIEDVNWALKELSAMAEDGNASPGDSAARGPAWVLNNQFTDSMCMDFMAPLLRGVLTPRSNRGKSLERFWEEKFGWEQFHSESDIAASGSGGEQIRVPPLVLFNASKVSSGSRFIVGFPPMPEGLEFRTTDEMERYSTTEMEILARNPPESPADLLHPVRLSLAQAVRLSANFPWGLPVTTVQGVHLLDGGVVDNTGLDSICEVLERLSKSADGRSLLAEMAIRGVVLLEIDSGAKPAACSNDKRSRRSLLEPLDALNNAAYTNADVAKDRYHNKIQDILTAARQEWIGQKKESLRSKEGLRKINDLAAALATIPPLVHYTFQCEQFRPDATAQKEFFASSAEDIAPVMTAWALGPDEKARVLSRFLVELGAWHGEPGSHCREIVGMLRNYAKSAEWIANLQNREELTSALAVMDNAVSQKEARLADMSKVQVALKRLGDVRQSTEGQSVQRSSAAIELDKVLAEENTKRFASSFSAPSLDAPIKEPDAFRTDVTRVKERLIKAKNMTDGLWDDMNKAIQKAPENRAVFDRAQQAIDKKAFVGFGEP